MCVPARQHRCCGCCSWNTFSKALKHRGQSTGSPPPRSALRPASHTREVDTLLCTITPHLAVKPDTMAPKFDLATPKGIAAFNGFISSKSYVEGYSYSQVGGFGVGSLWNISQFKRNNDADHITYNITYLLYRYYC